MFWILTVFIIASTRNNISLKNFKYYNISFSKNFNGCQKFSTAFQIKIVGDFVTWKYDSTCIMYCIFYIYIRKFNAFSSAKPSWFSEIHAFSPKNMHFSPKNMQFSPKNMQFFLKYMHFSIYVLKRLNRGRWYTFWIGWRHLAAIWDIKRT